MLLFSVAVSQTIFTRFQTQTLRHGAARLALLVMVATLILMCPCRVAPVARGQATHNCHEGTGTSVSAPNRCCDGCPMSRNAIAGEPVCLSAAPSPMAVVVVVFLSVGREPAVEALREKPHTHSSKPLRI